ncbi:MAG: hypothetical protein H3C43_02910 [Leptonema sp. (in: Bacteria)]|nr:hypothetical protein [Leptonema sp. (in: bacteria)]
MAHRLYRSVWMTTEIVNSKKGSRRSAEKMTVVDSLAAAYEKQDLAPEEWQFVQTFFDNSFDIKTVSRESLDRFFTVLRDITDRVALMNSPYPSDIERAFGQLEEFMAGCEKFNLEEMKPAACKFHLSHLTFHRETVADIIAEARELLMDDRRPYLQRLVAYQRDFIAWLNKAEKRFS